MAHFGRNHGAWLFDATWGRDERPVVTESRPVSVSCETTFECDLHAERDRAELGAVFTRLFEQVAADLQPNGCVGRTIGGTLHHADFKQVTRAMTVQQATADAAQIRRIAGLCLKRLDLSRRFRLLGVHVGSLQPPQTAPAAAENIDLKKRHPEPQREMVVIC